MKIKKILLYIVACFTLNQNSKSDPIISLFLRPYPVMLDDFYCNKLAHTLKDQGTVAKYCKFGILDKHTVSGIFVTYGGYLNVSNELGSVSFPLSHTKPEMTILVTNRLTPIMTAGNTVGYWELDTNTDAQMFIIEKKEDMETHASFWMTSSVPLPADRHIPTAAIVILAKPENIYVPLGAAPMHVNPNLILPDIYVKIGMNPIAHSLYMLNLTHLFSPVRYLYKQDPARYMQLIDPTI